MRSSGPAESNVSDLRINISRLPEGLHTFPLQTDPAAIALDERFTRVVTVQATVEKTARQLVLTAEILAEGEFVCDRCLEGFKLPLSATYTIAYLQEQRSDEEFSREEGEQQEVQVISPETNMVDLGDDVRQYLLLAVPAKLLCRESCAGLCPRCGANLNREQCTCAQEETDPRWEDLKRFGEN